MHLGITRKVALSSLVINNSHSCLPTASVTKVFAKWLKIKWSATCSASFKPVHGNWPINFGKIHFGKYSLENTVWENKLCKNWSLKACCHNFQKILSCPMVTLSIFSQLSLSFLNFFQFVFNFFSSTFVPSFLKMFSTFFKTP